MGSTVVGELFGLPRARRESILVPATAACAQVSLVNGTDLYVYNGADFFGVDSWIPVRVHASDCPLIPDSVAHLSDTKKQPRS